MENIIKMEVIETILQRYGFYEKVREQKIYIQSTNECDWLKLIFRVTLDDGKMLVIKILREDEDKALAEEQGKVERQSIFSEFLRSRGVSTPARYQTAGKYCSQIICTNIPCVITVEDWCGEEIREITRDIAYQIGKLMAQMHTLSLENRCEIGCGTLFSAAWENDVDVFPQFCEITRDEQLDQVVAEQIKTLRNEKLERIRRVWETLPKAAVQGDISINNLSAGEDGLTVFDYNNAGDEVLVSDLVLEGLLTAYEMDLPERVPLSCREQLFPALLQGYLSVRELNQDECAAAWEIYTIYHSLWFSRIKFHENSLEQLVKRGDYDAANHLLSQMLSDMTETDDGRFRCTGRTDDIA